MLNSPQFSKVLEQMTIISERVNKGRMKTPNSWSSAPVIQVTCFDDETNNQQSEKPSWKEVKRTDQSMNEEATKTSALVRNSEEEKDFSDYSNIDEDFLSRNFALQSGDETVYDHRSDSEDMKKTKSRIKSSNGSIISSRIIKGKVVQRKLDKRKEGVDVGDESVQLTAGVTETMSRSSSQDMGDSRLSSSRFPGRRRNYTVCSVLGDDNDSSEFSDNSESYNRRNNIAPVNAQNNIAVKGDQKTNNKNRKNKPKRIDLSLETSSGKNLAPLNRTRSFHENDRASDEKLSSDEDFRSKNTDDRRTDNSRSKAMRFPRKSLRDVVFRTQERSENGVSILKEVGVIPNTSPTERMRISSSVAKGTPNSLFVNINSENRLPLRPRSQSDQGSSLDAQFADRLLRPTTPKRLTPSPSKSDANIGELVACEEDDVNKRRAGVPSPLNAHKIGDTWNDIDPRKLESEAEVNDIKSDLSISSQSQRFRNFTSFRQQPTFEMTGNVSPVSPRDERKLYLAAAQPMARIRNKARSRSILQTTSQIIIDQAEKELDKCSERLPHISMEQVMKRWQTDRRDWNVVRTVVNSHGDHDSQTNMETVRGCRYIRDSVVTEKKRKMNSK